MKKTYYSPMVKIVNVRPAHKLLAGSGSIRINSTSGSVSASEACSRSSRFSSWEESEDE